MIPATTAPRRWAIAFALLMAGLASAEAEAEVTVRVGKAVPQAFSFVPLDVGVAEGIFERHGAQIEASNFAGSAKLQQGLAANGIDIGLGSGPELAFLAKGAPVEGVAAMMGAPALLAIIVRPDEAIHDVADLKGKTISSTTKGSLTNWIIHELSRHEGWGTDGINAVALGSDAAQIAAMRTKQIDGVVIDVATAYKLEAAGEAKIAYKFGELLPHFHIHVIYARRAYVEKEPEAVRDFLAAWFETIAWMRQHKPETVKIAAPVMDVSPEIAARVYDEVMPMFSDDGKFDAQALAVLKRSFVEMGTLPAEPDVSKLITENFLPSAH